MDNIWQQHKTFILKILGGLGVCLICWIIGASLSDKSLGTLENENEIVLAADVPGVNEKDIDIKIYPERDHDFLKWYDVLTVGMPPDYFESIGSWAAERVD